MNLHLEYIGYYFLVINFIAASVFASDKYYAVNSKRRVSENRLHILEALGGVFVVLPMMYVIRHKNRKRSYFLKTYIIFLLWLLMFYFVASRYIL